jgi:hypothetical protein
MHPAELNAAILALSKHKLGGVIGIVVGVVVLGLGALRVMKRMAGAALVALVGVVVVIAGILLYTRVI